MLPACKRRQRGCIWPTNNATVCARCTKLNLKCIPSKEDYNSDNDDDILPKEFAVKAIKYWSHQIDQLETDMQKLEHTTQCLSKLTGKAIIEVCKSSVPEQPPKQTEWTLSIRDGLLKLHSKVDTIEELLQYSHAFLKYLAPFEGVFQKTIINLDSMSYNILIRTFRIIFRLSEIKGRSPPSSSSHPSFKRIQQQTIPQLPSYLHMHYQLIIDHLVNTYCERENSRRIFLHIPAFREHYRKLKDPLTCPITLAVCIHILCTSKRIITHSATERREIADYFYSKCKEILYDMFDDPVRKLETIIVINLLQHFTIFVLLRFNEARRWSTVAYSLCKDLENDLIRETQQQQHNNNTCLPLEMRKILLQRHICYIENMLQLLSFMLDTGLVGQSFVKLDMKVAYMELMPGEDTVTSELIEAHNRLLQLCTSPYMAAITTHKQNIADSTSNPELSIDILVRLDTTIRDWWNELPGCLRLCDDLYVEDAMGVLEKNSSIAKAIIFSFVHSILFRIQVFVLDLKSATVSDDDDNTDEDDEKICQDEKELLYIRAKSSATVRSCELVLCTVTRMFSLHEDALPFMFEFISRAIYALLSATFSSKGYFSPDLREKFCECFDAVRNAFPPDNIVPPSISPLNLYIQTYQMDDTDVYQKYPLPGYAVLADLVNTCCAYLKSDYFQALQEPLCTYLNAYTCSALYGNFCFME